MIYEPSEFECLPDEMTLEQTRICCHIGKRTAALYYIKQQLQSPVWRLCATLQRMLWIGSRPLPLDGFP